MKNRQIPHAEWYEFFQEFSRRHEDWLVTVRVMNQRIGSQVEVRELPLEGIVADPEATSISIHLGRSPEKHVEHPVEKPLQVWLELEEDGAERALEIVSATGTKTILEFRVSQPAEMVDGLVEATPQREK